MSLTFLMGAVLGSAVAIFGGRRPAQMLVESIKTHLRKW